MLRSEVLAFETPNAVDPGDMPPSQPGEKVFTSSTKAKRSYDSRRTQRIFTTGTFGDNNDNTNDSDDHHHDDDDVENFSDDDSESQSLLSSDEKKDDATKTPNDELNEEEGGIQKSHSLPEFDEARSYAAALLNAANQTSRTKSSRDPSAGRSAWRRSQTPPKNAFVLKGSDQYHSLPTIEEATTYSFSQSFLKSATSSSSSRDPFAAQLASHQAQKDLDSTRRAGQRKRSFIRFCAILAGAALLLIVAVLIVVAATQNKNSQNVSVSSNSTTPSRLEQTNTFVKRFLGTSQTNLVTPGLPQYMAAKWIALEDSLALDIPKDLDRSAIRFIQRYILAVFYFSTNGNKSWLNQANFLSSQSTCGWFDPNHKVPNDWGNTTYALGVTCDFNLQVVNLLFPANSLQGSLPSELGYLTALTMISLPRNQLGGSIPDTLAKLSKLQYLDLKSNFLIGRLPDSFKTLGQLQLLALSNNYLEKNLPLSFQSLTQLTTLALDNNTFTGDLSTISNMTSLKYLYADHNSFSGNVDNLFLGSLPNLTVLDLSSNQLTCQSNFPKHLLQHGKLEVLDMGNNSLRVELPSDLEENLVLTYLCLGHNQLVGSANTSVLPMLRRLAHLDISGNLFEGMLPDPMENLKSLSSLFMGQNPRLSQGPIPNWLYQLKKLKQLSLTKMNLVLNIPFWLNDLRELTFLDLSDNSLIGTVPVEVFNLPNLEYLWLHNNSLNGMVPQAADGGGDKFRMVTLFANELVGDAGPLCMQAVSLQELMVDCNTACNENCCMKCCSPGNDNSNADSCFKKIISDNRQNMVTIWEMNYTRFPTPFP